MDEIKLFKYFEWKNRISSQKNYQLNRITNCLFSKEYRPFYKKYCGKRIVNGVEINEYIAELIHAGKPAWIARYGSAELNLVTKYLAREYTGQDNQLQAAYRTFCNNAGFFSTHDNLLGKEYVELFLRCCPEVDVHGIWPLYMEDYYIMRYEKNARLMNFIYLEPWALPQNDKGVLPWSHALKKKKVLVIHPFAETIRAQYEENRSEIFKNVYGNPDYILPEFELKTLKAVQTIAQNRDQRFNDWFGALDWMIEECAHIDFEIAIIGCGAYGFPLAAAIKKMGKVAIQMCGATQLLFGIMGRRWQNNESIQLMANDAWVHPNEKENVNNMDEIENACYW